MSILAVFVAACVPLLCEQCFAADAQQPTSPPKSPDGVRSFAEGVRIDWPKLTVEVDAEVVLREGPLELFACSPRTKEHESILVVPARPLHIHQALGLIGLTPGKPLRFDEEAKRWAEPRGDRVELRVRYTDERGRTITVYPENWVATAKPHALELTLHWVFAGSTNLPDGRFAADADGTIACLVDFESALIALGSRHTADNADLWLIANAAAIPPRGTKCTLLIRSRTRPRIEVEMVDERTVRHKDQLLNEDRLLDLLAPTPNDNRPADLLLVVARQVSDDVAGDLARRLRDRLDGNVAIEFRRALPGPDPAPVPDRMPSDAPP